LQYVVIRCSLVQKEKAYQFSNLGGREIDKPTGCQRQKSVFTGLFWLFGSY
jgi:hypothetical protein